MGAALASAALIPVVPVVFGLFFLAGAANTLQVLSIRTIVHDPQASLAADDDTLTSGDHRCSLNLSQAD
jgi:hypothetical protein